MHRLVELAFHMEEVAVATQGPARGGAAQPLDPGPVLLLWEADQTLLSPSDSFDWDFSDYPERNRRPGKTIIPSRNAVKPFPLPPKPNPSPQRPKRHGGRFRDYRQPYGSTAFPKIFHPLRCPKTLRVSFSNTTALVSSSDKAIR